MNSLLHTLARSTLVCAISAATCSSCSKPQRDRSPVDDDPEALPSQACEAEGGSDTLALSLGDATVLTRRSAPPGSSLLVGGRSFEPHEEVEVRLAGTTLGATSADDTGSFCVRFHIPGDLTPSVYDLAFEAQEAGTRAEARFAIRTDWAQGSFSASRTSFNPFENLLSRSNIDSLTLRTSSPLPLPLTGRTVVASTRIFALMDGLPDGTRDTHALAAFSKGSGDFLWWAPLGGPLGADQALVTRAVAATGGLVYAAGDSGLLVFDQACRADGQECEPAWRGLTDGHAATPTVYRDAVYTQAGRTLYAFPTQCSESSCGPLWTAETGGDARFPVAVYHYCVSPGTSQVPGES